MALVEPESRGDPESPLRWTCLSTRNLAGALTAAGHRCSAPTVARLLKGEGYSLQGNAKVAEGRQHPDRDAQFRYIARRAREFLDVGQPVVSVDAKKKEKVGEFANGGAEWRPAGRPERVNVHDFPSNAVGKAIPYGICDLGANTGWVSVGTDHDTSAFAAATLLRWWRADGSDRYPGARRLLICADSGGSNAARARAWKVELARLAAETGLEVTVCHYPPGTSKWNKVEHRLFAQITRNWRGRPLSEASCRRIQRRGRGIALPARAPACTRSWGSRAVIPPEVVQPDREVPPTRGLPGPAPAGLGRGRAECGFDRGDDHGVRGARAEYGLVQADAIRVQAVQQGGLAGLVEDPDDLRPGVAVEPGAVLGCGRKPRRARYLSSSGGWRLLVMAFTSRPGGAWGRPSRGASALCPPPGGAGRALRGPGRRGG